MVDFVNEPAVPDPNAGNKFYQEYLAMLARVEQKNLARQQEEQNRRDAELHKALINPENFNGNMPRAPAPVPVDPDFPFAPPRKRPVVAKKLPIFADDNPYGEKEPPKKVNLAQGSIGDRFGVGLPRTNEELILAQVKESFPKLKNEFVGFNTFVGIEIEAENCHAEMDMPLIKDFPSNAWQNTHDGSLRGIGREFISVPIRGINIEGSLQLLTKWMKLAKIKPEFSHRTSIHVHMNCVDLTEQQVRYIVLTYLAFENVLFSNFIKPERQANVYCVPISDVLIEKAHFRLKKWFKYAALNILPLGFQGTIEFRQLEGTIDIDRLKLWIKLLNHIYKFGAGKKREEIDTYFNSLNTDSAYSAFGQEVFGKEWEVLKNGDLLALMEDNILLCKLLKDKELF